MWLKLTADGEVSVHEGIPTLAEMYEALNCQLVEAVEVRDDGLTMWIDEEGKYAQPKRNMKAHLLVQGRLFPGDWVAGDVLFTGGPDDDGETTGLADEQIAWLRRVERVGFIGGSQSGIVNITGSAWAGLG